MIKNFSIYFLASACIELLSSSIQQQEKRVTKNTKRKIARQTGMMKAYTDGNIDLLIYQLIIGKNNIDKITNVFVLKGSGEKFESQYFCD